jgi:hypothetical protein
VLTTPVDRIRCSLVDELRVPARASSLSMQPSPLPWRVGAHITTFEACSSFTRVTACKVAHPPYVGFIARLRPGQLPGSDARKLSSPTNNLLEWVLPPLVIFAVEAHTVTPSCDHYVSYAEPDHAGAFSKCLRDCLGKAGTMRGPILRAKIFREEFVHELVHDLDCTRHAWCRRTPGLPQQVG